MNDTFPLFVCFVAGFILGVQFLIILQAIFRIRARRHKRHSSIPTLLAERQPLHIKTAEEYPVVIENLAHPRSLRSDHQNAYQDHPVILTEEQKRRNLADQINRTLNRHE